jgi:hypothetical protein
LKRKIKTSIKLEIRIKIKRTYNGVVALFISN